MSIGDIMARHRPILPQRGSDLGSLGFSLKKVFKKATTPILAVHNLATKAVAAPLKISSKIVAKLPGGSGISKALLKGAGNVTTFGTMSQNVYGAFTAPKQVTSAGAQPPATIETNTPYNANGNAPPLLPVDSSGAPIPTTAMAQDAGPVLAPWYEQPLYLGGIAVAGFVGWKLYQRMKRKRR